MRSELFRIPLEVGGVPLFGFGVLTGLWLVVAAAVAVGMLRRPNGRAEISANLPVFFVVTGVLFGLPWVMKEGMPVRGYGVMLVLAASTGLAMAVHRARLRGLDADTLLSMAFGMFVVGIAGARLFFVIEYWDVAFAGAGFWGGLKKAVLFTEGGLVVYGSLIGGAIAFGWFCHRRKLPMLAMADIIAPSLAVGLAIGRIGCLLNGCCYGGTCDQPWAISFPRSSAADRMTPPFADQLSGGEFHGFRWEPDRKGETFVVTRADAARVPGLERGAVITSIDGQPVGSEFDLGGLIVGAYEADRGFTVGLQGGETVAVPAAAQRDRSLKVHPTQIYSAVNAGLLGWFLWLYYPLRRRDGEVTALLLTIYPVGRFLLESIRTDESSFQGTGLSISQNVSIALLLAMVPLWLYLRSRPAGPVERLAPA